MAELDALAGGAVAGVGALPVQPVCPWPAGAGRLAGPLCSGACAGCWVLAAGVLLVGAVEAWLLLLLLLLLLLGAVVPGPGPLEPSFPGSVPSRTPELLGSAEARPLGERRPFEVPAGGRPAGGGGGVGAERPLELAGRDSAPACVQPLELGVRGWGLSWAEPLVPGERGSGVSWGQRLELEVRGCGLSEVQPFEPAMRDSGLS
ncbi:hypothetical protein [Kribbella sp. CA-293567]|uniref:hypothetical protein n=1 Tax=Kribbella sp. CA-293567 TaxID=3002436 RepID=UPI0022DCF278|nr:hypothetical protein [Kribbella sp. CA-293567]WBQ02835.1 hypothetical protein OX958_22950 [Kribbella sp. CA-293567]